MKLLLLLNLCVCALTAVVNAEGRKDAVIGKQRYVYDRSPFDRN